MPDLEELYREIILDHYRSPRNRGELVSPPAHRVEGFNPLCGDEVVLTLLVEDGALTDIKVAGTGCSISQSSASLMSAAVKGRTLDDVQRLIATFKGMMSIHETSLGGEGDRPHATAMVSPRDPRPSPASPSRWTRPTRGTGGPAGRGEVPRPDQVRHAELERPGTGPERAGRRQPRLTRPSPPESIRRGKQAAFVTAVCQPGVQGTGSNDGAVVAARRSRRWHRCSEVPWW